MNAMEVITMGRNRMCAAASAASTTLLPWACRSLANSMIRMAFLADRPNDGDQAPPGSRHRWNSPE